ncbi:hypothetical protein F4803DRAFT_553609 [Xylaria telfairii]|nr:hypothetical protein F4803DRAFT_553609 [Xylaria telfairii]
MDTLDVNSTPQDTSGFIAVRFICLKKYGARKISDGEPGENLRGSRLAMRYKPMLPPQGKANPRITSSDVSESHTTIADQVHDAAPYVARETIAPFYNTYYTGPSLYQK